MIRDITIGQYYQTDSVIHKLDPRVKLAGTVIFLISLFLGKSVPLYVLGALFLAMAIKISKVPFKFIVKGLKAVLFILIFSTVFTIFLTEGTVLIRIWKLTITLEGLITAAYMVIRLLMLIIGSSLLTLTTTPNNLTDGMERSLGFLKIFRDSVHEVAMMM